MKNENILLDPISNKNPITVQVLGICSALAVTVKLKPALIMSASVIVIMCCSSFFISIMRTIIPKRIRIIVQLLVLATFVILVDQILKAFAYNLSKQLSVFIGLIITNCIVMGRLESYSLLHHPKKAILDALGNSLGYSIVLIIVAFIREFLGFGKVLGIQVIPKFIYDAGYMNNAMMLLSPMALITFGIFIWIQRSKNKELIEKD